jgi:hypothetical protein
MKIIQSINLASVLWISALLSLLSTPVLRAAPTPLPGDLSQVINESDPETVFHNPPELAKPMVYWFWMGRNIGKTGITKDLEALKGAGFGGTVMCNLADVCTPWSYEFGNDPNPGMDAYISEQWWDYVKFATLESKRLGLDFGIANCAGYETSGGPWITPELAMQELVFSKTPVKGGARVNLKIPKAEVNERGHGCPIYNSETGRIECQPVPARKTYYRDVAVLAVPDGGIVPKEAIVDLTSKMAPDGTLNWDAPSGNWTIYRFGHTCFGSLIQPANWKATGLECDKMNPDAVSFHIDHVIGEMKKHLGDLVGHGLNFIWFDSYEAGTPTWTPKMREEFKARRGYDMTPFLIAEAGRTVGSAAETDGFKKDFDRTIRDLYRDVQYTMNPAKAHEAGLRFEGEPYSGPWVVSEVTPNMDRVTCEFWNNQGIYKRGSVTPIVKAAYAGGHNLVQGEAFTAWPVVSEWNETPDTLKPIGDGAFLDGVNRLILHRFTHNPLDDRFQPGVVMGQWGTHFDRTQTWWEPGKAWVQYLQRCQALLQWGKIAELKDDFKVLAADPSLVLGAVHRTGKGIDLYFVANTARVSGTALCSFHTDGRIPELWDPVTGRIRSLSSFVTEKGQTQIPLRMDSAGSFFIVFRKPFSNSRINNALAVGKNFPALTPAAELGGSWEVQFEPRWGGPEKPLVFEKLEDWITRSEPSIKYFSGTAVYRKQFDADAGLLGKPVTLDLGIVHHLARIKLNGTDLGVVWCAPWAVDLPKGLLKPSGNQLEIAVTNVWANRLIGDEQQPPDCEWLPGRFKHGGFLKAFPEWFFKGEPRPSKGRFCFTTWNYFNKDSPLSPSGLIGPVRLLTE